MMSAAEMPAPAPVAIRSAIMKGFKTNGLYLKSSAVVLLEQMLAGISGLNQQQVVRAVGMVADEIQAQPLDSNLVGEEMMGMVLKKWQEQNAVDAGAEMRMGSVLQVVPAFEVPRMQYRNDRKQFIPMSSAGSLHARNAVAKADVFRSRLAMLRQRTMRNALFERAVEGVHRDGRQFKLTAINSLLGTDEVDEDLGTELVVVMGLLTQFDEGVFYLEDLDGKVRIDLSQASFTIGMFTENCVVVSEGRYMDQVFTASSVGFPPPEPRVSSLRVHSTLNFFGGEAIAAERAAKVEEHEITNEGTMFVTISDVWLDKPQVFAKLRRLFAGFEGMGAGLVFVFMGNFLSETYGARGHEVLTEAMSRLSTLIADFEDLRSEATFIFVPGPRDVGGSNVLPRRPIPDYCTAKVRSRVKNVKFTTNPARVRYCSQEMVFFREDIVNKLRRNCIVPPNGGDGAAEISSHVVKTLVDQAHLCPLPLHVSPVYWQHDEAMRIYPTPDVLVLADKSDAYNLTYTDCLAFNPGSFVSTDFKFMVYSPSKSRIDPSTDEESKAMFESRVEFSQIS